MSKIPEHNMTSEICGEVPRIENPGSYKPKGVKKQTPNGLEYYEVALDVQRTDIAVIQYYDVVGPESDQTRQQADRISAGLGCKVVGPDWFMTGTGYPGLLGPKHSRETVWEWFNRVAPIEKVIERTKDIQAVLRAEGITTFVQVGHCWGSIMGIQLAAIPDLFSAYGLIHGRAFTVDQAHQVTAPLINLPSANEGPQPEFHAALPPGIKEKSVFKLYGDVKHGFSSGRGDWSDPLIRQRAQEVIEDYVTFVDKTVLQA